MLFELHLQLRISFRISKYFELRKCFFLFFFLYCSNLFIACSGLWESDEKSFSKKKCEKRALSQAARVLFSLCSFYYVPIPTTQSEGLAQTNLFTVG